MKLNKTIIISFLFSVLFCVCFVLSAQAAILYLEPSEMSVSRGETFTISVRIDPENECINMIQADLTFSNNVLQVVEFNKANSILSLWLKPPVINQIDGTISFIGGAPSGYCGQIPGDSGKNNLTGEIILRTAKENISTNYAQVNIKDTSKVLLNDGLGTEAKLSFINTSISITEPPLIEKIIPQEDEWYKKLKSDKIPPEPFQIEISQEASIFDGKYFIVFYTTDKQTGVDYYEVREIPQKSTLKTAKWVKVSGPPYLLQDQTLRSIIEVRAIDKAGNTRIERITPEYKRTWADWLPWGGLILFGIMSWLFAKFMQKKWTYT